MKATKAMIEREIRFWFDCLSGYADLVANDKDNRNFEENLKVIEHKIKTLKFYLKELKEAEK